MIDPKTILPFHYYTYCKPFTGSLGGKRYRIIRQKEEQDRFSVWVWPEPYAFEHTDPSEMITADFPFSPEGYEQVIAFLNEHLVEE